MTTKAIIIFIVFNVLNVVIQTIKSIATIKCGKNMAAIINAIAYGLYTYIVVLTASDGVSLWFKIVVVALANLVGVWMVKFVEEKSRKDKLWLVKITIDKRFANEAKSLLKENNIPFTFYDVEKYYVFDCYCKTQEETEEVVEICKNFKGKMFATENKLNL